jgi:hypothetical protein
MSAAIKSRITGAVDCAAFSLVSEGRQMKRPTPQKAEPSALNSVDFTVRTRFAGTNNPRHLRVLAILLHRPISRQQLDNIAGCANGPALVSDLRDLGLTILCERIRFIDRDGNICRPGVYSLTIADRRKVHAWMARRQHERVADASQQKEMDGHDGSL